MRRRLVDSYTDPNTSITYGLRGSPVDFALAQTYTHDHVQQATRDLLMKGGAAAVVEGFGFALAGNLKLSIAAGRAYDSGGVFYETLTDPANQPTEVTLDAADPAQPRIDLVYAVLEAGVQTLPLTRWFRRVASETELTANGGRNPYLPQPIERFAEEHARARVLVRKGVPAAVPVAPAANAGEAPLYQVRVNAGAAVLISGNVTDVRQQTRSLAQAWTQIDANTAALQPAALNESIDDRIASLLVDTTSVVKVYDDSAGTLQLSVPAEYIQDVVGAFVANGTGITVAYNDAGNTFTISVNTEDVQDMIAAFLSATANTGLSLVYNDATNTLTLAGVAATQAVMGMMSAADKTKLDNATSAATANALAQRDANGDMSVRRLTSAVATGMSPLAVSSTTEVTNLNANMVQGQALANLDTRYVNATGDSIAGQLVGAATSGGSGTDSIAAPLRGLEYQMTGNGNDVAGAMFVGRTQGNVAAYGVWARGNHTGGPGANNAIAYGGYFETQQGGSPTAATHYGIFATTNSPLGTRYAGYFSGNVTMTGSLSKGSGTFHIDHPVAPDTFDLVYGFAESPEYLNIYRLRVRLAEGQATIDIDEYFGHMSGTFAAENQDADVWSVMPAGHGPGQVSASAIEGGLFTIESTDPADAREVRILIFAARADQLIRTNQYVDADGRLISQQPKPALTEADVALLTPLTEIVEGEPGGETTVETRTQLLPSLIGKQGFRRNPEAFGQGLPAVEVTIITVPPSGLELEATPAGH